MAAEQNEPQAERPGGDAEDNHMPVQATEITRDEAIKSLLTNEDLSNLTLRGSDGGLVIANRCLLASRSPVFGRMLFGQFSEASKTTIDLGYDGIVLQAIVEYIYTDKVATLEDKEEEESEASAAPPPPRWDIHFVRFLLSLIDAARYFALPDLSQKVEVLLDAQIKKNHNVATLLLAVCTPDCNATKILQDMALNVVKSNPDILLTHSKSSVALIHPWYMEEIIKEKKLPMNEQSCFQLLQSWANVEVGATDTLNNTDETDWRTSRKRLATEMTNHIDLASISAMELSTTVTSSGLVTAEQLSNAYKAQALGLQERHNTFSFTQKRGRHVWECSRTTLFENHSNQHCVDRLECPILKSGVHKWSIKVLEKGFYSPVLGVASTRWPIDWDVSLCINQGGWGLYNGTAYHAHGHETAICRENLPIVVSGSIVSLTLDLDRGGILAASIDGDTSMELFSGMCQDHGDGYGFLPAISINKGARVEFLGFEDTGP